jgi:hypothetical protein
LRAPGVLIVVTFDESSPGHSGTLASRSLVSEDKAGVTLPKTADPFSSVAIAEATESGCILDLGTENEIS